MKATTHPLAATRTRHAALALTALSCATLLGIVACDGYNPAGFFSDAGEQQRVSRLGELELGLVGQGSHGSAYRLLRAIIMVQGPDRTLFFNTDEAVDSTSLGASVTPGSYSVFLQDGWFLQGVDDGVTAMASLLSSNPSQFSVVSGESTRVPLRFRVGADVVSMEPGSLDIVLEVDDPPGTRPEFCSSDADCQSEEVCCITGLLGSCSALAPGAACALPDLTISAEAAASSVSIGTETIATNSCAIDEGCVGGPGRRRLLRFDTLTPNIGEADFILGDPSGLPGFEFSECHDHFHFEAYARYELLDASGAVAATGHKQAFCLLDSTEFLPAPNPPQRFHCGLQGLTRGWAAIYERGLDCQWVDITGVPDGTYLLRLSVNPERTITESNYDNNTVEVPVTIGDQSGPAEACGGAGGTVATSGCQWSFEPGFQGAACTPGEVVTIGCGCGCQGDPMLRICAGSADCTDDTALAFDDDSCNLCPALRFTCPASGAYSALTRPFDHQPMSCELRRR